MGFFARIKNFFFPERRKLVLGLSLGSGGAKGMAHLGALKAFEEEGIFFSVITGASIGAIVGALYAKGYTSEDMIAIVEGINRREFAKNLRPFSDLSFVESFLERYLEGDISSLPKPFAAWVTDGKTNTGLSLKSGKLARALIASAAIPPFFRGVDIGGRKYYDGAFTNAVPADACKELGAEFVIGIDLAAYLPTEQEKSRVSRILGSAISAVMPVKYTEDSRSRGYAAANIMLRPNLRGYGATDISRRAMDDMYELGYREAKAHLKEIKDAIKEAERSARKRKNKERSRA
ncbi:MAG: patatin-like phospholipase family protein [Clostridia bacterium]|nr:patatin-like phospholipase family protein [Clostridia bacterium]